MHRLLLSITLIIYSINAFSQIDSTKSQRITVFDKNAKAEEVTEAFSSKDSTYWNAVALNPFKIIDGEIPFYFLHQLSQALMIEAGAGPTFKNFMSEEIFGILGSESDSLGIFSRPFMRKGNEYKLGYVVSIGLKWYPGRNVLEDLCINPEFSYRHNGVNYEEDDDSGNPVGFYLGNINYWDVKILIDQEDYFGNSQSVFYSWYTGVGIRHYSALSVYGTYVSDPKTGMDIWEHFPQSYKGIVPVIYFGYKIGFEFH